MVQAGSGLDVGSGGLCVSLAEGDAGPVAVHAADVDLTHSSLRLAGTKVAVNTLFEPITPGRVSLDQC